MAAQNPDETGKSTNLDYVMGISRMISEHERQEV